MIKHFLTFRQLMWLSETRSLFQEKLHSLFEILKALCKNLIFNSKWKYKKYSTWYEGVLKITFKIHFTKKFGGLNLNLSVIFFYYNLLPIRYFLYFLILCIAQNKFINY